MDLPYAENLNFWRSSKSSPDAWIEKAAGEIEKHGGSVILRAMGTEPQTNREAFLVEFRIGEDAFRAVWPVLPSKTGDEKSAQRQAATMLYHDVKGRSIRAHIFGTRTAFFDFLRLPDGRQMADLSVPELATITPRALLRAPVED